MYRPPENTNRVKTIRSVFENNEPVVNKLQKSKTDLYIKGKMERPTLNRQLSDPAKRNIKRTPAFRLPERTLPPKLREESDIATGARRNNVKYKTTHPKLKVDDPKLKFAELLSKFNNSSEKEPLKDTTDNISNELNQSAESTKLNGDNKNLSFLYSQPIPKALRSRKCDNVETTSDEENFCNSRTLKLTDITAPKPPHIPTLDLPDGTSLTDTLKTALSRPLPTGPPPKKPPRTFQETPELARTRKEFSDLLNETLQTNGKPKTKSDPKYMLDKLENALRNNKIRLKKQRKVESVTSGDESDDNRKVAQKGARTLPRNCASANNSPCFHLRCLNALGSTATLYERVNVSKSSFFVDFKKEEPVYAEPFQYEGAKDVRGIEQERKTKAQNRSSLYYMSNPIIGGMPSEPKKEDSIVDCKSEKQMATCDTSSMSSAYGSDVESAASTPIDDTFPTCTNINTNNRIKDIINAFETKKSDPPDDSEQRLKALESHIRDTLNHSFDTKGASGDSESDGRSSAAEEVSPVSEDDITNKFETYVRRVRVYSDGKARRDERLFQCCLLVGLNKKTAYVKMKFPENVDIPAKIEQLCFPDGIDGPMDRSDKAQCYSLVITDDRGRRTFGYCRRILPEGSENCLPLAYCILSKHRAPRFYKRILKELESRHGLPNKQRDMLLSEFYYKRFPKPGESLTIDLTKIHESVYENDTRLEDVYNNNGEDDRKPDLRSYVVVNNTGEYGMLKKYDKFRLDQDRVKSANNTTAPKDRHLRKANSSPSLDLELHPNELILALHQDSRYEDTGLRDLHNTLSTTILQKVFASLLLERKVILVSCVLSKLSACIEALQSILYPFSWPHTLIPILPQSLWEIVEAPTPFVCGVLSVAVVNTYKIDNAFIVDLDERAVLLEVGDEEKILPSALVKTWKNGLGHAKIVPVTDSAHAVFLSDAYLRVFIHSCGHYRQFIVNGKFDKEGFMQQVKSKGMKRFLTWFTETTMFHTFLDGAQNDPSSFAIFDKRIQIYGSEESSVILDKMRDWKKEKTRSGFFRV